MLHVFDIGERVFHIEHDLWGTVVRINDPERDEELSPEDGLSYGVTLDGHFAEYEVWPDEIRPLTEMELKLHMQRLEDFAWR